MTELVAADPISLSDSAVRRIAVLLAQEDNRGMMLRVAVSGGGCSGFQYGFTFDDARGDTDLVIERDGALVVVDDVSMELLRGSQIDFVEDLAGSTFAIRNPQAKTSCGCGNSFSI